MDVVRDSGDVRGVLRDRIDERARAVTHHVVGERDGAKREVSSLLRVVDGHAGDFLAIVINGQRRAGGLSTNGEGEVIAIAPVAALENLGEVGAHELIGRDARVIGVDELPVTGHTLDGSLELASLGVIADGNAEGSDVVRVGHATGASMLLGDLVLVLAGLRVDDRAKVDLRHAVGGIVGANGNLRRGRTVVTRGDGSTAEALKQEGEAVAVLPVATLKDLRQTEVRRSEAGVLGMVRVLEQDPTAVVVHDPAIDLRRNRQRAVKVIDDGDGYLVRVVVIGNARDLIPIGGDDLCHIERVGLVGALRAKDDVRQLCHILGDAACAPLGVGEALVGIGEQGICLVSRRSNSAVLGSCILASNGEGEHAHIHGTAGEDLAHDKTGIVGNLGGRVDVREGRAIGNALVLIDRRGRVVIGDVPEGELAIVINDSDSCSGDMAIPRDTSAILVRSVLANYEGVLARLGEGHLAGLKVDHVAAGLTLEGHVRGNAALGAGDEAQGEVEVVRIEHVTANKILLALDDAGPSERLGRIGVLERSLAKALALALACISGGDLDDVLSVHVLVAHDNSRNPDRGVIRHAGAGVGGDLLGNLVLVGLAHVLAREGDSLEDHDAMGIVVANELERAGGHGSAGHGRQRELEHIGLERQRARRVVQRLRGDGCPLLRSGVEGVREPRDVRRGGVSGDFGTEVVAVARDPGRGGERSVVVVLGRDGHGVEGE